MGNPGDLELWYEGGAVSAEELQRATDELLVDLRTDLGGAADAGTRQAFGVEGVRLYTVTSQRAGLSAETVIVVMIAPQLGAAAQKVAVDVWSRIILPRLEQRFGVRPLGREMDRSEPSEQRDA